MKRILLSWCVILTLTSFANAAETLLRPGDTLALVGGTLIERMQSTAAIENELQCRRPDWKLRVRNLGWSGDNVHGFARKVFETDAQRGFERLINDLKIAKPSVVLVAYGFAEASNGGPAMETFESGLFNLVEAITAMKSRVILLRPFVVPGVKTDGYAKNIAKCGETIDLVAKITGASVVAARCDDWSEDRLSPSAAGFQSIGEQLATSLVGGEPCGARDGELDAMIIEKNELFFHRHRPQNETYLMLFRKHEQGNNVVELPQFDPLVEALDQKIWGRAGNRK